MEYKSKKRLDDIAKNLMDQKEKIDLLFEFFGKIAYRIFKFD